MRVLLVRFVRDSGGASAIDYSLIVAAISLTILVAVTTIGIDVSNPFRSIVTALGGRVVAP
jgi:pilus assembly protein Flp/PilA